MYVLLDHANLFLSSAHLGQPVKLSTLGPGHYTLLPSHTTRNGGAITEEYAIWSHGIVTVTLYTATRRYSDIIMEGYIVNVQYIVTPITAEAPKQFVQSL